MRPLDVSKCYLGSRGPRIQITTFCQAAIAYALSFAFNVSFFSCAH